MYKEMVLKGDDFMKGDRAFNKRDESPIVYCLRVRAHCKKLTLEKQKAKQDATAFTKVSKLAAPSSGTRTPPAHKDIESPIDSSAPWKDQYGMAKLGSGKEHNGAVRRINSLLDKSKIKDNIEGHHGPRRMSIPDEPGWKEGSPIQDQSGKMLPPPTRPKQPLAAKVAKESSLKSATLGKTAPADTANNKFKAYQDILHFLSLHYIRSRPDMEARDLINGKDASGLFEALPNSPKLGQMCGEDS
jgi:hypothetical protein